MVHLFFVLLSPLSALSSKTRSTLSCFQKNNAQHSNFSLEEISLLLSFRDAPTDEKSKIRALAGAKVQVLSERIDDLVSLRNELQLLVKKCADSGDAHCPIIDSFSDNIKE